MEGFSSTGAPRCGHRPYGPICDIALNLLDDMFQGVYNEKKKHESDLRAVLQRGRSVGCDRCIVTCGSVEECLKAAELLHELHGQFELHMTVGVHPTRCGVFKEDPFGTIGALRQHIQRGLDQGRVVAIGECGLDYDRLEFCDKDTQKVGFRMQLELADEYALPLFLHDRNTDGDLLIELQRNFSKMRCGGVVHSFTGTLQEMRAYTELGLFIGVNGCSLKTEESLQIVAAVPLDLLLLETDAPWCGIKNTHASKPRVKTEFESKKKEKFTDGVTVKDRCEPCHIINVLEVVASLHSMDPSALAAQAFDNTNRLFFSRRQRGGSSCAPSGAVFLPCIKNPS